MPLQAEKAGAIASAEYRMINSFKAVNFKCFRDLSLTGLQNVNVLVGESGSGKTSLLEAMFLAAGMSGEHFLRTQSWRGSLGDQPQLANLAVPANLVDAVADELFFRFEPNSTAHLEILDSSGRASYVDIAHELGLPDQPVLGSIAAESSPSAELPPQRVVVRGRDLDGEQYEGPFVDAKSRTKAYPMVFFTPSNIYSVGNAANRYSQLSIKNKEGVVLSALKELFPRVRSLSLESPLGKQVLYASVDDLPLKVPVASLSGGLNKFLTILLAIASQPKGVVAIDEVENGFYFKQAPQIWRAIVKACYDAKTQLFVTTHSYEFLEATLPAVAAAPDRFALLHLRNDSANGARVDVVEGRRYELAIRQQFEVRQ